MDPMAWHIGPKNGHFGNKSVGMPAHPSGHPDGLYFDWPQPSAEAGHVHAMMMRHGSLRNRRAILARGRIEAAPGVQFHARSPAGYPAWITIQIQRAGDDWTAKGEFEAYRWNAVFSTIRKIEPGPFVIEAPLDHPGWTAVETSTRQNNDAGFRAALEHACCIGLVFGGGDGYAHGAYADGPARFILEDFLVE